MNIIFGIWRVSGPPIVESDLRSMASHTRKFASSGEWFRTSALIGFGVQAQHTNERSLLDQQPTADGVGNLLAYDGRLDNYGDLISELSITRDNMSDAQIILSAFRQWGTDCFRRLIGDWALALWDRHSRTLYLARDHAGTRLLHYSHRGSEVLWGTYLDNYLGDTLLECPDPIYLSSYLAMLPCYARTPYRGIQSVLPGFYVKVTPHKVSQSQFWTPAQTERVTRRSMDEYSSEFLHLLEQSVARRTGPGAPILAQLSGGMDSTSIVCIADRVRNASRVTLEPIDTLSYFNDSEPSWNERPYFTVVEAARGRVGYHLDTSQYRSSYERPVENGAHYLYPGIDESVVRHDIDLLTLTGPRGHRAMLSGIGGDEFTGGNPNPVAEVAELFSKAQLGTGLRTAITWCLAQRLSLVEMMCSTLSFLRSHSASLASAVEAGLPKWLTTNAREQCSAAMSELPQQRLTPFFIRPKAVDLSETWWFTLRTQPHLKPSEIFRYEFRYPFLDRDLLEFLLRIPYDVLARPGRRRSLMRLTLKDIVPETILERRRKAFLLSSRLDEVRQFTPRLAALINTSLLVEGGYVDRGAIQSALEAVSTGKDIRGWSALLRFAILETWIRHRNQRPLVAVFPDYSAGAHPPTENDPARYTLPVGV